MSDEACKFCNSKISGDAIFCSKCGSKIIRYIEPETPKIPKAMTVKEAVKIFFSGTISEGFIYTAIREHRLPHVRMSSGKILLDVDELNIWWKQELEKSKYVPSTGLRRIF